MITLLNRSERLADTGPPMTNPTKRSTADILADALVANGPFLIRYLATRCGVEHADDLFSEVAVEAFRAQRNFDSSKGSERAWLFGIANKILLRNSERQEKWRRQINALTATQSNLTEHSDLDNLPCDPRVLAALNSLPEKLREVLLLSAVADLGIEGISRALKIRKGTVKSRLSRAREQMQGLLAINGYPIPQGGQK